MSRGASFRRWHFSDTAVKRARLPSHLRGSLRKLPEVLNLDASQDLVVGVARAVVALHREEGREGIIDAYPLRDRLVLVDGGLTVREFPKDRLPRVRKLDREAFARFEIDPGGSFVHWPSIDVHMGPSQFLQAVDPVHLADVEMRRYALDKTSRVLQEMREERSLRQADISGLSERHVRRLEKEEARLTGDAAARYAAAFDATLPEFLQEFGRRIARLRDRSVGAEVALSG